MVGWKDVRDIGITIMSISLAILGLILSIEYGFDRPPILVYEQEPLNVTSIKFNVTNIYFGAATDLYIEFLYVESTTGEKLQIIDIKPEIMRGKLIKNMTTYEQRIYYIPHLLVEDVATFYITHEKTQDKNNTAYVIGYSAETWIQNKGKIDRKDLELMNTNKRLIALGDGLYFFKVPIMIVSLLVATVVTVRRRYGRN